MDNVAISSLLAEEALSPTHFLQKALRKAARAAYLWPEEASALLQQNRSLTELSGVGPHLAKLIQDWIEHPPPLPDSSELRASFLSLPEARKILRQKPHWRDRLLGDLQMHTYWSDGSGSVQEMGEAAVARNYRYIAITDHSKGLKIAGGITEVELRKQAIEINAANERLSSHNFQILKSIEMNLNPQGAGDMETNALSELDVVLGSFHSALRKTDDQTPRYLAAIRNPDIQILGHPRGRIYNYRLGLKADWARVFAEAARLDKAVEIDSYPDRQDLDLELLKIARVEGVRISIGTDAHHPWQLEFIELGLAAAAAAGIPENRILNFLPARELLQWVQNCRGGNAPRSTQPRSGGRKKPVPVAH